MHADYEVAPIHAGQAYGAAAPAILADLAFRYETETGLKVQHWAMWVFPNGSAVPVPTQLDHLRIPAVRACRLLSLTLKQINQVGMHSFGEADRFFISTAIEQLEELYSLGVA